MGPTIFLNLANNAGEYIAINAEGWEIIGNCPTYFAHHRAQLPLPRPPEPPRIDAAPAGDCPADPPSDEVSLPGPAQPDPAAIARLRSFFPCDDLAWHRCLVWLFAALHPSISYPLLIFQGPPASGKSTAARFLRSLLDPSTAPLLDLPYSRRRIYSLAARQWITVFDHVSEIPRRASDALCRVSTGADHQFHNRNDPNEAFLHDLRRPVLITAPPGLALQPDLAARALLASFPGIPPASRRAEAEIWEEFEKEAPSILGALCSAASIALQRLREVRLPEPPASADAARWAVAAAPALGIAPEELLSAFQPVEPDPLAGVLSDFMSNRPEWRGSASTLLAELGPSLPDPAPSTPKGLSQRLRRLSHPSLLIEFDRNHDGRTLSVTHRAPKTTIDASRETLSPISSTT